MMAGASFWESDTPGDTPNQLAMKCAPYHQVRLAGALSASEILQPLQAVEAMEPQIPDLYLEH